MNNSKLLQQVLQNAQLKIIFSQVVDGYFVHFFAPEGMDPIPKDVLFILDVSSSMSGTKIQQQRDAMDSILQDLHEGDQFNIMEFSTRAKLWQKTLLSANTENKQKARDYARKMKATGCKFNVKNK